MAGLRFRALWLSQLLLGVSIAFAWPGLAAETDPQRVEERLPGEQKSDSPSASVAVDEEDLASIQPFVLNSVAIEGMTAIDRKEGEACTSGQIGRKIGAAGLLGLTHCLTRLYRDRDYFLSRAIVPPQEVHNGALTLRVIEGYISAIEPAGLDQADADAQFAPTLNERPARLATFERGLLLIADRYGHRVKSSRLATDPRDPARFTFKVEVSRAPVTWRVFGDNRGDARQGPEQGLAFVAWNAPFGASDRIVAQVFSAPTDMRELLFAELGYGRAWFEGLFWTEFGTSISRSSGSESFPEFTSESERYYGRIMAPVIRTREHTLWAKLQLDARNADILERSGAEAHEQTRALRGSLSYTLVKGATRADLNLEVSRGLDAFGASKNDDTGLSRPDARPQFTKLRLDASMTRKLFAGLDVVASGVGQWADGALTASEELGAGGARYGRAYDYSEIVGDSAIAGSIELRWTWKKLNDWLTSVQIYGFADAARMWNLGGSPLTGPEDEGLASAGGGVRFSVAPGLHATFEVAKPLSRDVASQGDRTPRVFVSVAAGW